MEAVCEIRAQVAAGKAGGACQLAGPAKVGFDAMDARVPCSGCPPDVTLLGSAMWRLILCCWCAIPLAAADPAGRPVPGTPFFRYTADGGRLTFYLSAHAGGPARPIVLFVQGTGCDSPFILENGRILSGVQSTLHEVSAGSARIMVVEKPGVQYLDNPAQPADAKHCRPEFVQRYSLESWSKTLVRALEVARTIDGVDRTRTLVIGHSEGAIVGLRVSNQARGITHVAALSGGGPSYLFHMSEFFRKKGLDPEKELYPCWADVLADPASTTRFCWGQTFRQWSSFMKTSVVAEALRSRSALYFGHGTRDAQNPISAFDVLRSELAARGRKAVLDRVEAGDHGFDLPGQEPPAGFVAVFGRILAWFRA